jgi:peptide/nickel transport system substrate-binding protein
MVHYIFKNRGKSMKLRKLGLILFTFLFAVGTIVGCSSDPAPTTSTNSGSSKSDSGSTGSNSTPKTGGTLKIAYPAQPQTLDPHKTTANATRDPARLIYETLVTLNENYEVTPQLAETYQVSEDGKTVTFSLRKDITFHNGKEMKAEDVVASMTKWGTSSIGKALKKHEWVVKDDYTVELQLETSSFVLMHVLAEPGQFAAIMPKEIIESAGATGVTEYVGTGPFKLEEWKQDQYILFKKFEDYQPVNTKASGLAGKKEALVSEIYHYIVPDESTRVTGLMSGEYHFAHMLPYDAVPQIETIPGAVVDVWPFGIQTLIFNKKQGLFRDAKARQAVNYALDKEEILTAAFTDKKFFELDPGLFLSSQLDWYTDAGKELYNQKNIEKAKELLKESGYNGEEVVILTSRDYAHHYNSAVATEQQLKKIGINAKLDVYDWATLLDRRGKPEMWDIFYTAFPVMATPHQYTFLDSRAEWPGWTNNPEIDRKLDEINQQSSQDKAKELFAQLQQIIWEDVPIINVGKNLRVSGYSDKVQGYTEFVGPVFWNVTVTE